LQQDDEKVVEEKTFTKVDDIDQEVSTSKPLSV